MDISGCQKYFWHALKQRHEISPGRGKIGYFGPPEQRQSTPEADAEMGAHGAAGAWRDRGAEAVEKKDETDSDADECCSESSSGLFDREFDEEGELNIWYVG